MRIRRTLKMKKEIKLFSFCLLLVYMTFFNACAKNVDLNNTRKKNIALIVKMNYGYHWGTVKLGADTAAREFNVYIDYAAPDDEQDVDEQIKLVNQVLEKKVDALILAASDYKELAEVTEKAYSEGIPVIIIDSEVDTEKIHSYIGTDNLDAGKKAGNILIDIVGTDSRIAIMSFVKGTKNAKEREEGLLSVISQYPKMKVLAKEYSLSDTTLAYNLTKKIIAENGEIDAIVALNEISSEGVAQAIDEMNLEGKVKVIAFGSTLQEINYLEKGIIQATIIEMPFSVGYLGVKYAVEALRGEKIPRRYLIDSKVISRENMYLPENQKLLFPFIK
jgi:ribose transport system substrate-binding protein